MSIEHIITIVIATIGWTLAVIQFFVNRKWQKCDYIKQQRYEAYKGFMNKLDSIGASMRLDPSKSVFSLVSEFLASILQNTGNEYVDPEATVATFSHKLLEQTKLSCEPLQEINGEINNIKLIASKELLVKLEELQKLNKDLYNEMMLSLNAIGKEKIPNFESLQTVGQQERWNRFQPLQEEIRHMMRKEIGIE